MNLNIGLVFEDLGDFQLPHLCLQTDEPSCAGGCMETEVGCQEERGGQLGQVCGVPVPGQGLGILSAGCAREGHRPVRALDYTSLAPLL